MLVRVANREDPDRDLGYSLFFLNPIKSSDWEKISHFFFFFELGSSLYAAVK